MSIDAKPMHKARCRGPTMDAKSGARQVEIVTAKRTASTAVLVCVACYAGATIDMSLRFPGLGTAIVFPPYAIVTVALLFSPPRRWWIYLLAATVGNFWPHRSGGAPVSLALLTEIPNHVRAMVAAYGILRFGGQKRRFDSLRGMSVLLFFSVFFAPVVAAFLGAAVVKVHDAHVDYWLSWRAWLLSNTLTGLTLLPLMLISLAEKGAMAPRGARRWLEAAGLTAALLVVGSFVLFGPDAGARLPAPLYAPLPLLLWAAVRFGPWGTSASLLVVGVLAIGGTLDGQGPFVSPSPDDDLVHLQLFLLVVSVPLLLLSALIQEQRRTERALGASQQQYRRVVEDQTEMICRFRVDGTLTFVNVACCRAWQESREALLETTFWSHFTEEKRTEERVHLAHLTPESPLRTWEYERGGHGAEIRWEQWKVRVATCEPRGPSEYQAVGRDITERKQAEEQRRLFEAQKALADALREADIRKDEFLAMLAHELRHPLAPIAMAVDILGEDPPNFERVRRGRDVIGRQLAQLTRLVDDLLDVSRITCGTIQVHLEAIDLAEVVAAAVETAEPLVAARKIALTTELPRERAIVRGDAVRLTQLFANLLSNAAKYTDTGGRITVTVVENQSEIVVRIADTGVGIPAHMLDRVFEPFTQVDRSRDAALGGLGLGLNLVKRLVQLHGGTIEAHSEGRGRGSQFVVRLSAFTIESATAKRSTPPTHASDVETEAAARNLVGLAIATTSD